MSKHKNKRDEEAEKKTQVNHSAIDNELTDDVQVPEKPKDLPLADETRVQPQQPTSEPLVAPGVDISNPTKTPKPVDNPNHATMNSTDNGKSPVGISDGLSPVRHEDAIAENKPSDAPAVSKEVTFDSSGVPIPTTVGVTPHAPSAADYENSPTKPLLTNTPITPQGPGTPPTPMVTDANSQVTATTSSPTSEANPVNQKNYEVNSLDSSHDAQTYYVYNEAGMFQKFFTQQEFKGEAYKFAKEYADQNPGFYVTE